MAFSPLVVLPLGSLCPHHLLPPCMDVFDQRSALKDTETSEPRPPSHRVWVCLLEKEVAVCDEKHCSHRVAALSLTESPPADLGSGVLRAGGLQDDILKDNTLGWCSTRHHTAGRGAVGSL